MFICWSRLIPRLILLFIVLAVLWRGQEGLVRWMIRSNIRQQTGADVEIGSVQMDWRDTSTIINDVRIFDPKNWDRELIRAEKIFVRGDRNDLLHRYFQFPEINAEGIRIVVEETGGRSLIPDHLWNKLKNGVPKELKKEFESVGEPDWSVFLTEEPKVAAKVFLQQLETSQLLDRIKKRWPNEVQHFETTASLLKQRLQNIKGLLENIKNPADKFELFETVLKEFEGLDQNFRQLLEDVTKIESSAQRDYQSLVDAAKGDREKIQKLQTPRIDANRLSEMLVGQEVLEQWDKTVTWGDWARSLFVPVDEEDRATIFNPLGLALPKKIRGEKISLTTLDARSELLIKTANLTGQILFGNFPVYFNGTIKNIANPVALGVEPVTAQFCFSGSGVPASPTRPDSVADIAAEQLPAILNPDIVPNIYATLTINRLGEHNEDQLIICCPMYQLPERILGNSEKLAISVSSGTLRLDGVLMLQGEKLSGEIRVVQSGTQISVILPAKYQGREFQQILQKSLDSAGDLTASVLVSGTRTEPVYVFKSNIAELIVPQIMSLATQEWDLLRQETEQLVLEEANQGTEILNSVFRGKIEPMMNDLNTLRAQWEQNVAKISGVPFDQLVQSQLSKLSPNDMQRLGNLLQSPSVQALLNQSGQPEQTPQQIEQLIQRGADKLQDKIPGLLDKLRKKPD
jgi:uncharacterized protein (TIGR03545 family)